MGKKSHIQVGSEKYEIESITKTPDKKIDHMSAYRKEYYKEHSQTIKCDVCSVTYNILNKGSHEQTKKHLNAEMLKDLSKKIESLKIQRDKFKNICKDNNLI